MLGLLSLLFLDRPVDIYIYLRCLFGLSELKAAFEDDIDSEDGMRLYRKIGHTEVNQVRPDYEDQGVMDQRQYLSVIGSF